MRSRTISMLSLFVLPALGSAVACGSSSNSTAPDAGSDSGAADGSVGDTGTGDAAGDATAADAARDGGNDSGATDGGILGANCPAFDGGTPFVEATHAPLPTMAYYGGQIQTAPEIVTFTFSTTPAATTLQAYGKTLTQTPWFQEVMKDYGYPDGGAIQAGPDGMAVNMTVAADATYVDMFGMGGVTGGTDLNAFINQQIAAAVTANLIPAPSAGTLYAFYFPPTSTIWMGPVNQGTPSCQGFGAYHSAQTYSDGTTPIVYAIMPDCPTGDTKLDLEEVEISASHEVAEAVSDPNINFVPAWYLDQSQGLDAGITIPEYRNDPWANSSQFGEIGDNCESIPASVWALDDAGTVAQRIWSQSAAAQGHNPCVPVPTGESYYNASTDKAIYVASVGETITVDVSAFSDAPRVSWRLDAIEQTPTSSMTQYLKMEFVNGVTRPDGVSTLLCVNNGTKGQLKVTLLADPGADSSLVQQLEFPEADGVIYSADVANGTALPDGGANFPYQFWPFAVVTPATAASLGITDAGVASPIRARSLRAGQGRHTSRPHGLRAPAYRVTP